MVEFIESIKLPKIVGILNITPDSFSDGGKFFKKNQALLHLKNLLAEGADIIDIGAESTRPNSQLLEHKEEWQRLENILPEIIFEISKFNKKHQKRIIASIDSYHYENVVKAYEIGIKIVNDISGLVDERIIEFIAQKNLNTILMHNLAIHANPDLIINQNLNVNEEIITWAKKKIIFLRGFGIKKSQLIFDPGIGFSKNSQQSIRVLKNIDYYKTLGLPIYVGHSKKSFLDELKIEGDRAQKTLSVSQFLAKKGVDYLRVHDVKKNIEALKFNQSAFLI